MPFFHLLIYNETANQTAYLLYASDNNQNFKITQLDANYYNVTTNVAVIDGELQPLGEIEEN